MSPLSGPPNPQSGERLEAQSWEQGDNLVMIGTEDFEALVDRLPNHGLTESDYPVRYSSDGIEIMLPQVPAHQRTTLHFVVAVNCLPEPKGCSAWFAVDLPHQQVLGFLGES